MMMRAKNVSKINILLDSKPDYDLASRRRKGRDRRYDGNWSYEPPPSDLPHNHELGM